MNTNMQQTGQAVSFIRYNGKFELSNEATTFLENLPSDMPLGVISIVGKYRTGKSFFVNRVLLNRSSSDGFSVGPTINPCTKGLWLWTELLSTGNPEFPKMQALVIDTEGFGGMDENLNHDTRIFLFSLLLSSFFIYNSVGNIDENALNNISLIVNLAKDIQMKHQPDNTVDPAQFFPQFLWVVRDFALKMVDSNGTSMPSKEYLEKALEQQKGLSDAVEQKNRIRRLIKHFFRERDCITMVRPVESETDLQRLDQMGNKELRSEFVDQIKQVQAKVFKRIRPKVMQGNMMTGPMLLQLAKAYIEAINSGGVPNVESAWGYVCRAEGERAVQECILDLEKTFTQMRGQVFNSEELQQTHARLLEQAMKKFRLRAIGQEEDLVGFKEKLVEKFESQFKELKHFNKSNIDKHYIDISKGPLNQIEEKLSNEQYQNFFELQNEMFKFREQFEKAAGRSAISQKFFEGISLQVYQSAAEKLSRRSSNQYLLDKKHMELRHQQVENELSSRRQDWENEKQRMYETIQRLEKEKTQLMLGEQGLNDKNMRISRELERLDRQYQELQQTLREKESSQSNHQVEQNRNLAYQLDRLKNDALSQATGFEKEMALLNQENQFLKRENSNYHERFQLLENESKKHRNENAALNAQNDSLHQRISQIDQGRALEIQKLQQEFERKVQELTQDIDKQKKLGRQQNEFLVEKNYLENQVSFLKSQLDENKRLHDALLLALQCILIQQYYYQSEGINQGDSESTQELVETNRNLSAAVDKMEMRCKLLEDKAEESKKFKKMIKNCSSLQCLHCQKIISQPIFLQHLNSCNGEQQSVFKREWSHQGSQQFDQAPVQTESQLQVSINQTMVRETADNKPYTEYMIKVQLGGDRKWTVSRRYKNFCELHQALLNQFPGLKLPDSSASIVNAQDMSSLFQAKRPTVIEDRRKALQQYLRDLSKIDIIRNSKCYRKFLDWDQEEQQQNNRPNSQIATQIKAMTQPSGQIFGRSSVTSREPQIQMNPKMPLNEKLVNQKEGQSSYRIDKKLLPQSPSSFLKSWNEKQINQGDKQNTQRLFISDLNIK